MQTTAQLAHHFRCLHTGGNWTAVNLKDTLADVSHTEAIQTSGPHHSVAVLVYHIHYFTKAVLPVLQGGPLEAHDRFSFDCPPIQSPADWAALQADVFCLAEALSTAIEALPDEMLEKPFTDEKYGTYFRNILGVIEHAHYHLGQIALIKKLLRAKTTDTAQ